jgi:hypothetical protein
MLSPATPAIRAMDFPTFLTSLTLGGRSSTKHYATNLGVDEAALIRYANGAVSTYEQKRINRVLAKSEWARRFVIDHVKRQRNQRSVA